MTNLITYFYLLYYDYKLRTDRRYMLKELHAALRDEVKRNG